MKTTTKFALSMIVLAVAGATIASQFVKVRLVETQINKYTTNAGELVRDALVGQTFVAQKDNLSGIAVMFATYSNRNNTQPVKLHLRQSLDTKEDLRTAMVMPGELRDNQFHRFKFEPISDSKGKTYFFFLVSPQSSPGNAVTVDLNTQDPYYLGSAFIVRDQGSAVTDPSVLSAGGKPTIDVVFETYHTVTAREAAWTKATGYARTFIGTWDEKKSTYWLWARFALPVGLFLLCVGLIRRLPWGLAIWLPVLLLAAFFMRLWYASELPLTTDEGNYLYDAWTLLHGKLAGGDGYVKAPLVVVWISIWQFIFGHTILAGRLSSIVIGTLTLFPIYALVRDLFDKQTGLVAAAAWAFFGSAIVFDIYVHTQPVAIFLGVFGLSVLLMGLKGTPLRSFAAIGAGQARGPHGPTWFALAGVLLGLAVASRKSMLALGLIPILFILFYGPHFAKSARGKQVLRQFFTVGISFAVVIGLFLGVAWLTYGTEGIWEALGANSAEDGINVAEEDAELIRAYSLRGMTPFFRESLALIWFAVVGWGIASERAIRALFGYLKQRPGRDVMKLIDHFIPKIGWVPAIITFIWCWRFFNEYEGAAFHILGIPTLWWVMGLGVVLVAFMPRQQEDALRLPEQTDAVPKSTQPGFVALQQRNPKSQIPNPKDFLLKLAAALVGPLWMLGLVVFYTNWIKFHANYIAEFIPPLILLAAPGVMHLFDRLRAPLFLGSDYPPIAVLRKLVVAGAVIVMFWALYTGSYITFLFEHTGTFAQASVEEAAAWAKQHISPDEPIFTGAALVPYVSGHRTSLDIAHPRWYAYEFTRRDTERLNTFLPPAEEMVQAFKEAKWVLQESQTQFSFFVEYADLEQGLPRDFVKVHEVENGSNPLTFYQRVR